MLSVFPAPDSPLPHTENHYCYSILSSHMIFKALNFGTTGRNASGFLIKKFKPDDAALVLVVALHVEVTVVSDGEDVRRHLSNLPVGVEADLVRSVDGQQLIGIHCDKDGACVRLQETRNKIEHT